MNQSKFKNKSNYLFIGAIASLSLLFFYFLILTLANSFSHALEQFVSMWYWLLFLAIGFGAQFGLYWLIRDLIKSAKLIAAKTGLATSGSISTVSMIACCAHHLVDLAPLIGLSALWLFFADYQLSFVLIGLFANLIGIVYILNIIKKHNLAADFSLLQTTTKYNLSTTVLTLIIIGFITVTGSFYYFSFKSDSQKLTPQKNQPIQTILLEKISKEENGLIIDADPDNFQVGQNFTVNLSFTTHEGDLNFDLLKKAILIDNRNRQYKPTSWDGGTGGHHLAGNLTFPKINPQANKLKLVLNDIYEVPERIFEWKIK